MLKRILTLTLLIVIALSFAIYEVQAATVSPAPTISEDEKLIDEINNLREKVASKVAELNLVEKRGIFITVQEVSGNKITGFDLQEKVRITDVDELTKFSSPSARSSFGISDISEGSRISVVGLYNKQSKRILARFIESISLPQFITGHITEIDKANFTITVTSENKTNTIADIENITRTSVYTKEDGAERLGFSRLNVGDRVHVVGFPNIRERNRITASRILVFAELPKNPNIPLASSDSFENPEATPSSRITPEE